MFVFGITATQQLNTQQVVDSDEKKKSAGLKFNDLQNRNGDIVEKYYLCNHCGCRYRNESSLKIHIFQNHHKSSTKRKVGSKSFSCQSVEPEDQKVFNSNDLKLYSCNYCRKAFKTDAHLVRHAKVHFGVRPYICEWPECDKTFTQKCNLDKHVLTHTGERRYVCACGKKFTQKSSLKEHEMTHTGERRYSCEWPNCDKKFTSKGNLKKHLLIHSGERPHVCEWQGCGKKFFRRADLRRHAITHEDKSQVSDSTTAV